MKTGEIDISSVKVRPMLVTDVTGAMKLSVEEGWNQTEDDWKLFIENPGNLCLGATFEKEIIATTAVMNYANAIAWIGMVLVDKAYRGQGLSKLLLAKIFANIESFQSVKLDATPAGQQVYTRFGFKEEFFVARMVNPSVQSLSHNDDGSIIKLHANDLSKIIALDNEAFGADRTMLIRSLVKRFPNKAWMVKRNDMIEGFVLGRKGYRYHHIGPVIALTEELAKTLIAKALNDLHGQPVVADVICDKQGMVSWLTSIGFDEQRRFMRMYKEKNPFPGSVNNYYLICGPEYG